MRSWIAAIALFGGAFFTNRSWAMLVPLAGLLVSDLVLAAMMGGLYASWFAGSGIWVIYGCFALTVLMGFGLDPQTPVPARRLTNHPRAARPAGPRRRGRSRT